MVILFAQFTGCHLRLQAYPRGPNRVDSSWRSVAQKIGTGHFARRTPTILFIQIHRKRYSCAPYFLVSQLLESNVKIARGVRIR
jgi:hypothetical protein